MKITMTPPLRNAFERAAMEEKYKARLIELFENEVNAFMAHNEWYKGRQSVFHRWYVYNQIAHIEACHGLLPSEKKLVSFVVEI